jgi:osmotically-inducible protein OsmY
MKNQPPKLRTSATWIAFAIFAAVLGEIETTAIRSAPFLLEANAAEPGTPVSPGSSTPLLPRIPAPESSKLSLTSRVASSKVVAPSDQETEQRLRHRLEDDPQTRPFARNAHVQKGQAILVGRTYHSQSREQAGRAAAATQGVKTVRNLIVVEPNVDLDIAQKLHEAFSQDPLVDDAAIGVTVVHRKVFLSGTAVSSDELARVNQITLGIPGVLAVSNGLQLSPTSR